MEFVVPSYHVSFLFLVGPNRFQRVKVAQSFSNYEPFISGVPQGSVLGPFLFLLFIKDLPSIFTKDFEAKLFADDLKSYTRYDYRSDPSSIQGALNSIVIWSKVWQLPLSDPKCGSLLLNINCNFHDNIYLFIEANTFSVGY